MPMPVFWTVYTALVVICAAMMTATITNYF